MSAWAAINVEPEDDSAIELDDTKEIQLEEAFKFYQNALRIHAQGPAFYDEAKDAYDELFQSEVFRYPEALSQLDHEGADEPTSAIVPANEAPIIPLAAAGASDNANSLPQLVYLAYKSRAQFEIDVSHTLFDQAFSRDRPGLYQHYANACRQSLIDSAAALERDDTDLDLWKRAARVSDVLQTLRLVRFCTESVLAGDEEGEEAIDLSGLDEAYANSELQSTLTVLEDDLTLGRTSNARPRNALIDLLRESNDPYPSLPRKSKHLGYLNDSKRPLSLVIGATSVSVTSFTYLAVTEALLQLLAAHGSQTLADGISTCIKLGVPDKTSIPETTVNSKVPEEPHDSANANTDVDSPATFHSVPDQVASVSYSPMELITEPQIDEVASPPRSERQTPEPTGTTLAEPVKLPSRKRSSTAAGNDEPEARTKSKRIRARESLVGTTAQEEEVVHDPAFIYREQLLAIEEADEITFRLVNSTLDKLGVAGLGNAQDRREAHYEEASALCNTSAASTETMQMPMLDLKHALKGWNDEKNAAFVSGHGGRDQVEKSTGLSLFLKHSKGAISKESVVALTDDADHIQRFVDDVNSHNFGIQEAIFMWMLELFTTRFPEAAAAPYILGQWSEILKQTIVELLIAANEALVVYFEKSNPFAKFGKANGAPPRDSHPRLPPIQAAEYALALFEVHLDIYSKITNPTSTVSQREREQQWQRLGTWAQLATDTMQLMSAVDSDSEPEREHVVMRFLWASVMYAELSSSSDKSHVLLCLDDLQQILKRSNVGEIVLPNNVAMPIISDMAAEQERSKVKTLDFFMSVFDSDNGEPVSVISKLEPILEFREDDDANPAASEDYEQIVSFRSFLRTGDASLTLFLWKRLQNAYTAISYNTKVVSCLLRSVETITQELTHMHQHDLTTTERETALLRWLRDADELITKALAKIVDDKTAFECIDEHHLRSSISAIVSLIRLTYEFVLTDDALRVGQATPPNHRNATAAKNFEKSRDRFREMVVKLWTLLYHIVKESTVQLREHFDDPSQDLVLLLRSVHNSIGGRQYCKYCNKLFVRTAKAELFSVNTDEDLSPDIAQIIFDLYGIKLYAGHGDADHGCVGENLEKDKKTIHTLVPIIMDLVKRLNVKDVLRSDLKATIDRIQNALGQPKASTALSFNRRIVSSYLKSVINPKQMYQSLKGIGELETKQIHGDFAKIAAQGWYLLLANMTLAKYKSVKRVNPTPTDELDIALGYLRQDIEHDANNWESWYRIAQVYDAKIEDNLIWNSNKLNDGRAELATLERNAINGYTMATALAMQSAEDDVMTTCMINDMFFEFAVRLYSSSRPPLNMEAFSTDKAIRHLSDWYSQDMSKKPSFDPIPEYTLWSFAAHLIRRSLSAEARPWLRYYILGKCLWKKLNHPTNYKRMDRVEVEDVVNAFTEAVIRVPKKERSSEPILEPHYKLVSTIHKLHERKSVSTDAAVEYLQAVPYAKGVQLQQEEQGSDNWDSYILIVLKKLQNADKSGWHHRITARAARIDYREAGNVPGALGAKHHFIDSIFTKTMMMQVWKPENERAGRHYVYTGRYLRFFISVLETLKDRSNLEQVVRKIRRKTTDFINHTKVWEDAMTTYIDLLRDIGKIPRGRERGLFDNISFDDFTRQSEKLEIWAHEPTTTTSFLDTIKDAVEMKKLNNSLMKGSTIDDLIGDTYACMYELFVSQLPPEEQEPPKSTLPQGTFINLTAETAPTGDDNLDRMRLSNLMTSQTDGAPAVSETSNPATGGLGIVTQGLDTIASSTPPTDSVRANAPLKPGRAKTITRREVQRKAETAIGKPPPIKTPTLTKRSIMINVPSIKKEITNDPKDKEDDGDGSIPDRAADASGVSSRRGSISVRNTPDPDAANGEGEGSDGDNEAEDDDNDDDNDDDENTDQEGGEDAPVRKQIFPGLKGGGTKDDDMEDDAEDEEADDSTDDKSSNGEQHRARDDDEGPEIPDSEEPATISSSTKDRDQMDTD